MRVRAVLDQMEVGKALLLLDAESAQVIWPVAKLPADVKEGDIIYIDITVDKEETKRIREENQRELDELMRKSQGTP